MDEPESKLEELETPLPIRNRWIHMIL